MQLQVRVHPAIFGVELARAVAVAGQVKFPGQVWGVSNDPNHWPEDLTDEQWEAQNWLADREEERAAGKLVQLDDAPPRERDDAPAPVPAEAAPPPRVQSPPAAPPAASTAIPNDATAVAFVERLGQIADGFAAAQRADAAQRAEAAAPTGVRLVVPRDELADLLNRIARECDERAAELDADAERCAAEFEAMRQAQEVAAKAAAKAARKRARTSADETPAPEPADGTGVGFDPRVYAPLPFLPQPKEAPGVRHARLAAADWRRRGDRLRWAARFLPVKETILSLDDVAGFTSGVHICGMMP